MPLSQQTRSSLASALASVGAARDVISGLSTTGSFHVFNYGATGEGAVDDTGFIQRAIDDAEAFTATDLSATAAVIVPRGNYMISGGLSVTGDRIRIEGQGTLKLFSTDTTAPAIIDVTGDEFSIEGITLDGNNAGHADAGHCLRMAGENNRVSRITCRNAKSTGIVAHVLSRYTNISESLVTECPIAVRVRGDNCVISYSIFLNFASAISEKGVLVDPVVCDTQYFGMFSCYFKTDNVTQWNNYLLIDPGDGGYADDGAIALGAAASAGGKVQYTLQMGHGFHAGDGFRVAKSATAAYNDCHKVIATTGDIFAGSITSTTFKVYPTAADAIAATNAIDITGSGSGTEFYVSTPNGGRRVVTNATGVNATTNVLTTDDAHGFLTGEPLRLTPRNLEETLPGGLERGATITLNTAYSDSGGDSCTINDTTDIVTLASHGLSDGDMVYFTGTLPAELTAGTPYFVDSLSSSTFSVHSTYAAAIAGTGDINFSSAGASVLVHRQRYYRHKRIETVELSNVVMDAPGQSSSDGDPIKVNNVNNLRLECVHINHPPDSANDVYSLRLGGNNRFVNMQSCDFAGGMIHNVQSSICKLRSELCTFGDGHNLTARGVDTLQSQNSVFKQCTFRTSASGVRYDYRDEDLEWLEFDCCTFEGYASARCYAVSREGTYTNQLNHGGKVLFRRNNVRRNASYAGLSVSIDTGTDVLTVVNHTLKTGDAVYFSAAVDPDAIVSGTVYYVRVTGADTVTLHTTEAAATLSGATPINFGTTGTTVLMHSPIKKIGMGLSANNTLDLLFETMDNVNDLEDVVSTRATAATIFLPIGTTIWNRNIAASTSPGWIVSEASTPATTVATVKTMPALGA